MGSALWPLAILLAWVWPKKEATMAPRKITSIVPIGFARILEMQRRKHDRLERGERDPMMERFVLGLLKRN